MILLSILLVLAYGDAAFFDLSFRWSLVFSILGIAGTVLVFLPGKKGLSGNCIPPSPV